MVWAIFAGLIIVALGIILGLAWLATGRHATHDMEIAYKASSIPPPPTAEEQLEQQPKEDDRPAV